MTQFILFLVSAHIFLDLSQMTVCAILDLLSIVVPCTVFCLLHFSFFCKCYLQINDACKYCSLIALFLPFCFFFITVCTVWQVYTMCQSTSSSFALLLKLFCCFFLAYLLPLSSKSRQTKKI